MIHIGTCGFSYDDWVGPVYPADLAKGAYLSFYAREFTCLELNTTFYRLPDARFLDSLERKTPPAFQFVVKAFQGLTHQPGPETTDQARQFRAALAPLLEAGKMGGVLLQFPYSFHRSERALQHLADLLALLEGLPTVVEFRNVEWLDEEVLGFLRERRAGFCSVDQPRLRGLLPSEAHVTTEEIAYVRFHGRNAAKWWEHAEAWERYDYLYTENELREWLERIEGMGRRARNTFVFFNNHRSGQAIVNARQMRALLGDSGPSGGSSPGGGPSGSGTTAAHSRKEGPNK